MLAFGACPQCKLDIAEERKRMMPIICNHCGHTVSKNEEKRDAQAETRTIALFGSCMILILASFIQLMNWDNYSLEMIPLKIKESLGASSTADLERMAQICMDLKKWDCVEANYIRLSNTDSTLLPRLGAFEMKRAKYNEAAQAYYAFFQKGGSDLEASYNYAKALAQLGQVDEAIKYFDQVLAAKPDVLQVTVVQNYVKLLMDHQRYDQAKKLIANIRKTSPESASFMDVEYKKIQDMTTASRE
jgi:tetratricopeptide (TPR) repeat protein